MRRQACHTMFVTLISIGSWGASRSASSTPPDRQPAAPPDGRRARHHRRPAGTDKTRIPAAGRTARDNGSVVIREAGAAELTVLQDIDVATGQMFRDIGMPEVAE